MLLKHANRAKRSVALAVVVAALAALGAPAAFAHGSPPTASDVAYRMQLPALGSLLQGLEFTAASEKLSSARGSNAIDFVPAGAPKVQCDGNGTSGKRVQVLYVRPDDVDESAYEDAIPAIADAVLEADHAIRGGAAQTFGARHIRFVHNSACALEITHVEIPAADSTRGGDAKAAVVALGFDDADRKYVMFVDAPPAGSCGSAGVSQDDSPGSANAANSGPNYPYLSNRCWGAMAHELMHSLGAVHDSAPHRSAAGHCTDEFDIMCYDDDGTNDGIVNLDTGDAFPITYDCGAFVDGLFFPTPQTDCHHDDYFHTDPPAGSYLDTHWNAADSDFLGGASDLWGFVRAARASDASYTPIGDYNRSSTYALNTVVRTGTGVYEVTFPNLVDYEGKGGVTVVTSYGSAGEYCNANGTARNGPDTVLSVRCFDTAGMAVDAKFDASFARPSTTGDYAYIWANDPSNPSYNPNVPHQFNSTGALNWVTRSATGVYQVELRGLGSDGGTVKITTVGESSNYCKVEAWEASGADELVDVLCFDFAGAPVDSMFRLVYANEMSILADDGPSGYVWANDAAAASYTPDSAYQYNSTGALNTVTRTGLGLYTVTLPGLGDGGLVGLVNRGIVHLTAQHTTSKRCQVADWRSFAGLSGKHEIPRYLQVDVACHTASGGAADSRFVLQFTT